MRVCARADRAGSSRRGLSRRRCCCIVTCSIACLASGVARSGWASMKAGRGTTTATSWLSSELPYTQICECARAWEGREGAGRVHQCQRMLLLIFLKTVAQQAASEEGSRGPPMRLRLEPHTCSMSSLLEYCCSRYSTAMYSPAVQNSTPHKKSAAGWSSAC